MAQNSCLTQYDETITDFNTLSHSEHDVNSEVKNLYNSSRVDFSQPKQDVSTYFDKIDWENLPNSFVIKCNHGCKWHFIIKNKENYLKVEKLVGLTRRQVENWLEQDYSFWGGFEMQYKTAKLNHNVIASKSISFQDLRGNPADLKEQNKSQSDHHCTSNVNVPRNDKYIEPKILIEPLLREEINTPVREIEVYCFNGKPKIFVNVRYGEKREICYYGENFNYIDLILHPDGNNIIKQEKADDLLNQTFDLSIKLSQDFKFVRCDWLVYKNKLYFNELTFTPYSGFMKFDKKRNKKLGSWINLGDR